MFLLFEIPSFKETREDDKLKFLCYVLKVLFDIISCMASVKILFPSVVYLIFNKCHVIVYVQIEN